MNYGMYLSAAGITANSYRQDVIANNLANSEAVGFKRDLALLQQRPTAAQEQPGGMDKTDPTQENIGGGLFVTPSLIDTSQGDFEPTGNNLDVGIEGKGFFAVNQNGNLRLTRNGRFVVDRTGRLALDNEAGPSVLDAKQLPIQLKTGFPVTIANDGTVSQQGQAVARVGVFDVGDPAQLKKEGETLMSMRNGTPTVDSSALLRTQALERSNVDPTTELTELMEAQRQLEANANMIRTQDEMLSQLVSSVGKVS